MILIDVQLQEHLTPGIKNAVEQGHHLLHGLAFLRIGKGGRIGYDFGVARENRVDHLKTGSTKGSTGFGDLDNTVGNVRNLGLGGAIGKSNVGLDTLLLEELLRDTEVFRLDTHAVREVRHRLCRRITRHSDDHPNWLRGVLGVFEFSEAFDNAARFLDPVATGDTNIEEPFGDVRRNLLGTKDPDRRDSGIVDRRLIVDRRGTIHRQVGSVEQFERCLFE